MSNEWPKKITAKAYRDRWHVPEKEGGRCKQSIINDIQAGRLPGGQEATGAWYVWVNADMSPAHGYQGPGLQSGTGNQLADEILKRQQMRRAS